MPKKELTPEQAIRLYSYVLATKYHINDMLDELIRYFDDIGLNELAAKAAAEIVKENNNDTE